MQYLSNGSWNKRLHPGFAAHDAFICVTLAEAGVLGAAEPVEGRYGLLNVYSSHRGKISPILARPFLQNWEFLSTAIKPYPACRMTHGQIELASKMRQARKNDVKQITIHMAKECFPIVGEAKETKVHPKNIVDAQFSAFYQTAVAWLYGSKLGWRVYDHISDPEVFGLSEKTQIEVNDAYRGLETGLKVEWDDGTVQENHLTNPTGEVDNPITWEGVCTKFLGLADNIYGQDRAEEICEVVRKLETLDVAELMTLVK